MAGRPHDDHVKQSFLEALKLSNLTPTELARTKGIPPRTANDWVRAAKKTPEIPLENKPRILIWDIETSPNRGFFFDCFSDRGIPLQFIEKPKAVLTIAYKWYGEKETKVLIASPYEDKHILDEFRLVFNTASYTVAHYGDKFDLPFVQGRLAANGLDPLPTIASIDTYKLAKKHFGKSLNSNKLDHLGDIFGVGNKNKTDATLWVRCANGDPEALKEMALYNVQDVELLERVFTKMLPYVKTKLNHNLFVDDVTRRCKACGSEALEPAGYELAGESMKDRMKCLDCKSYSSFKMRKQ